MAPSLRETSSAFLHNRHHLMAFIHGLVRDGGAATDIFQEVWLRLADATERGATIEGRARWCRDVARDLIHQYRRGTHKARVLADNDLLDLVETAFDEQDTRKDDWAQRQRAMLAFAKDLPSEDKHILNLKYGRGLPLPAVATRSRKNLPATMAALSRLRRSVATCTQGGTWQSQATETHTRMRLDELIGLWEDGRLSSEETQELKDLLHEPQGRAGLVEHFYTVAAVTEALRKAKSQDDETETMMHPITESGRLIGPSGQVSSRRMGVRRFKGRSAPSRRAARGVSSRFWLAAVACTPLLAGVCYMVLRQRQGLRQSRPVPTGKTSSMPAVRQNEPPQVDAAPKSDARAMVVTGFALVHTGEKEPITGFDPIPDGAVLDLRKLPTRRFSIHAKTVPERVGSVHLRLKGPEPVDIRRNTPPYTLTGSPLDPLAMESREGERWEPKKGDYTLTATPYAKEQGEGEAGRSLTIRFTVVE